MVVPLLSDDAITRLDASGSGLTQGAWPSATTSATGGIPTGAHFSFSLPRASYTQGKRFSFGPDVEADFEAHGGFVPKWPAGGDMGSVASNSWFDTYDQAIAYFVQNATPEELAEERAIAAAGTSDPIDDEEVDV